MSIPTDACGLHITRLAPWRSTTTYQALLACLLTRLLGTHTTQQERSLMTILAIETEGRPVALTENNDVVERLNTDRLPPSPRPRHCGHCTR